ncbi:MAG TPA: DUF4198 domain-containing protein [Flavobacteriaceae bacterium]|jgi:uncharacterized GH25 family protein|nr:DUF4198 domain-containing protein [Flavobacteriaceae bacterium]HBS12523.1 DUF4198 domain-containing protein [Flavobacteriaceae bacterium]
MKKSILALVFILFATTQSFAHYLWIETNLEGKIGQEQEIRVYFGEYTHGVIEKVNGESFPKVKDFTLWVIDASGKKTELKVTAAEDYYLAKFTPTTNGAYTVTLNNNNIQVFDFTKYDFGIFKTHYHSIAKIQVGDKLQNTITSNKTGITLKDVSVSKKEKKLQVLYKNKPLPKNEVKIFVTDQWSKTLKTDENGFVSFKLPWQAKYLVEVTKKEEVPGVFRDEKYDFIWHCATYCIE